MKPFSRWTLCVMTALVFTRPAYSAPARPDLRCGSYCLYVSLAALDVDNVEFSKVESLLGQPTARGYSLGALAQAAKTWGVQTMGVKTTCDRLAMRDGRFACIARLDGNHFVNIVRVRNDEVDIVDPPKKYTLPRTVLDRRWDGTALLVATQAPLAPEEDLARSERIRTATPALLTVMACTATGVLWFGRRRRRK